MKERIKVYLYNKTMKEIDFFSEKYNVTFVISTAVEESMLPAEYAANVVCKL